MKYIDASRYSNTGKMTGVENYSYHLISELVAKYGENITLISPRHLTLKVRQMVIPFPRFWTLIRLSWEIWRNKKIDNLFVPSHVLPLIHPKNSIITIHDVVFKYSPKSYSLFSRLYLDWATKFAIKHAAHIITPSQATKKDLIRFYKAKPEKVTVIPLGFEPHKEQGPVELLKKFGLEPKKYFLFIGRIEYKKNSDTLIKAFKEFSKENNEVKLVLAGFPGHGGKAIIGSIPTELKSRIILTGYVKNAEKTALLKNTLCFIFPSRFEGFGIPLLEAMNAEVPIIASNIPSSREVAENSALFFEKENADTLTKLMKQMAEGQIAVRALMNTYPTLLKKHSWAKCAEEVYGLLTTEKS
ncbi:glycosyltransferase family 4 protein [Candidatus Peregrinibacteria bacterium]|nr:glycosyltransferase family 4 protein [Candidatus Peregrinibacteria bacterium]